MKRSWSPTEKKKTTTNTSSLRSSVAMFWKEWRPLLPDPPITIEATST